MKQRFSPVLLKRLRNDIQINTLIEDVLKIPAKRSEGYLRFVCPLCSDTHTATNPGTNLARCFRCKKNFNPIDMVMAARKYGFIDAVQFLKPMLNTGLQDIEQLAKTILH